MDCGDPSLLNAKQNGITLGISPSPPYSSLDPGSNKASGLDVEIHEAALKWIGINKIKYEVMPFGQLISAMLAKRIDVVAVEHSCHARSTESRVLHRAGMVVRPGDRGPEGQSLEAHKLRRPERKEDRRDRWISRR